MRSRRSAGVPRSSPQTSASSTASAGIAQAEDLPRVERRDVVAGDLAGRDLVQQRRANAGRETSISIAAGRSDGWNDR